jgi:hypothetical protein
MLAYPGKTSSAATGSKNHRHEAHSRLCGAIAYAALGRLAVLAEIGVKPRSKGMTPKPNHGFCSETGASCLWKKLLSSYLQGRGAAIIYCLKRLLLRNVTRSPQNVRLAACSESPTWIQRVTVPNVVNFRISP